VVVTRRGGQWVAQGLEYNLSAQAPSDRQAIRAFVRILRAHIRKDIQLGRPLLFGVPGAPNEAIEAWKQIESRASKSWESVNQSDLPPDTPPAYILAAAIRRQ
jgi:hypothetical protein